MTISTWVDRVLDRADLGYHDRVRAVGGEFRCGFVHGSLGELVRLDPAEAFAAETAVVDV